MMQFNYLLWQMAARDVSARYRGSIMGLLWSFVTPLAMLVVYTFVFSEVFQARWNAGSDDKVGFAINLFVGLILHGLFAECASRSTGLVAQHSSYVKRVVFPLWILAPVTLISALFHSFISFAVLLVAFAFFYGFVHWQALLLPVLLLPLSLMMLGMIWLLSAVSVFVRDIAQVVPVVVTAMLFMAPVFYPVTALPEAYQGWLAYNPLTPAIETIRALLIEGEVVSWRSYLRYLMAGVVAALIGFVFFARVRRGFADVI